MVRYVIGIFIFFFPAGLLAQESAADSSAEENIATFAHRSRHVQARNHFRQAQQLEDLGDHKEAILELDRALTLRHDHEEALWLRAQLKRMMSDYSGALTDYQALLHLAPDRTEARFERARLLYNLERYEAALADFRYLLENATGETNAVYFRGATQNAEGSGTFVAKSATTVQSGIQADIWNFMGLCYLDLGELTKANTYFELALSQNPQDPNLHSNLGLTAERSGDTLGAIQQYRAALMIQPNHPVALQNFSYLTRKTHQLVLAEATLSRSQGASPQNLLHQGMIQHQQGHYRQAIALYDQAIGQQPREPDFYLQRGFSYEKLNQLAQALQDYTKALQLNPTLEKAFINRGNVYYKQQQLAHAAQDYRRALELNPDNAKVYYNLGLVHHRLDQYPDACEHLEKALQMGYQGAQSVIQKICENP